MDSFKIVFVFFAIAIVLFSGCTQGFSGNDSNNPFFGGLGGGSGSIPSGNGSGSSDGSGSTPSGSNGSSNGSGSTGGNSGDSSGGNDSGNGSSGNGSSDGSSGDSGNGDGSNGNDFPEYNEQALAQVRAMIEAVLAQPNPPLINLIAAIETAQGVGLPEEDALLQKLKAKVSSIVDNTLNDPNSSIRDLLEALELAQTWDVKGDETYNTVIGQIKVKLNQQLADSALCKKQLLSIAEVAQSFGIEDVANTAMQRVNGAKENCATINFKKVTSENGSTTTLSATITGTPEEYTIGGFSNPDSRMYYFTDGKMAWNLIQTPEKSGCVIQEGVEYCCEIIEKKANGTELLKTASDGTMNWVSPDQSSGSFYKPIKVNVNTAKGSAPPNDSQACDYVKEGASTEDEYLDITFKGTSKNKTHWIGNMSETTQPQYEGDTFSETTTADWDIQVPEQGQTIKVS